MKTTAAPQMKHCEIFTGAYLKARRLNRKYPVTKKHIPEGHKYCLEADQRIFRRKNLEAIKEFSGIFVKNELRSKLFNHIHYMELSDYLLFSLAAKAQEKAPISESAYRQFISAVQSIFENETIPYDVIMIAGTEFWKRPVFGELDALYQKEGKPFADFAVALGEIAFDFRKGYSGMMHADKDYLEKMRKRNQPEHALLHAVFFTSLVCFEIGRRYPELEKEGGKAFIL